MIGFTQYSNYSLKSLLTIKEEIMRNLTVNLQNMSSEQVKDYKKRLVAINAAIAKKQK